MTGIARRLLVAAPTLLDPNFTRTVLFVVEHDDDGAFGVVLNRPTGRDVGDVVTPWARLAVPPTVLFEGGPVQFGDALVAFGRVEEAGPVEPSGTWQSLLGPVGSLDLSVAPDDVLPPVGAFRAFTGYAGWGPRQLDDELDAGGWLVVDAEPDDLLTEAPDDLWRRVLRRQGGDLAMVANRPPDPTVN